jgi:AcrR family transcriptional regulator
MVSKMAQSSATKDKLIKAGIEAFARSGLEGATTKEIAQIAGVNEVTLFRHFQSKERLLAAVVDQSLAEQQGTSPTDGGSQALGCAQLSEGVNAREILFFHAKAQHQLLTQNLPLIRAFIGEIHRHCDQEKTVTKALFLRHKQALEIDLQLGQNAGFIRKDINLNILANQFLGVIFSDVLKRSSPSAEMTYSWDEFLEASVDLFARGLECVERPAQVGEGPAKS